VNKEIDMRKMRYFLLLLLAGLSFTACDVINPSEDIPGFIYVESFTVQPGAGQGTSSAKISEVWVSAGPNFLGAYSLPALIPILEEGETEIILSAGIKDNGVTSTPEIYPFYDTYETVIDLKPNEVDTISPVIGYKNNAKFAFNETFENNGHLFKLEQSGLPIEITPNGAFEGNSARILLNEDNPEVEIATNLSFSNLYSTSIAVYLEVNYKSDVPVIFGLTGLTSNNTQDLGIRLYDPGFRASAGWNKIYFNLSGLDPLNEFSSFRVSFLSVLSEDNDGNLDEANIYLDNIKLLHF
jgi:hypothetical protein